MPVRAFVFCLAALAAIVGAGWAAAFVFQTGDLIFNISRAEQGRAIQIATGSVYSHVGLIFIKDGKPLVFEAGDPVGFVPLRRWIACGKSGEFAVKRLKQAGVILTPEALRKLENAAAEFAGRPYDYQFQWSDDRLYCSELVWKIYHRALGLRLVLPLPMREMNLADPIVQAQMQKQLAGCFRPEEPVVSPAALYQSEQLVTVYSRPGTKLAASRRLPSAGTMETKNP